MYKVLIFLSEILLFILLCSFVVTVVFYTVDIVKELIDDWRE